MNLGAPELLILAVVVMVVFGAGWLPKAARNLGKAKVEMDKAQRQFSDTKQQVVEATGIEKVEATVRKANKALNTSPQGLLKGAAASAMRPKPAATADDSGATDEPDASDSTTVNVDYSDE